MDQVLYLEHEVRRFCGAQRPRNADRLDIACALANPRRIHHRYLDPIKVERNLDEIARRARFVGDDCHIATRQRIQQAGLAGIRCSEDDDFVAIADDLRAPEKGQVPVDLLDQPRTSRQISSETDPGTSSSSEKSSSASIIARAWMIRRRHSA